MDTDIDELEPPHNGNYRHPSSLPPDASRGELIAAVNILVRAVDSMAVEQQMTRDVVRGQGTRFETSLQRIERALGIAKERATIPPPKPEDT